MKKMKQQIVIRVDGNAEIGLGHVVRCLAMAIMLKNEFSIRFYCHSIVPEIEEQILDSGFSVKKIKNEDEFLNTLTGKEIVVLDHYDLLNSNYQKKIKDAGCKLVCIDDTYENEFLADLIINHSPCVQVSDYNSKPYTNFALGLGYALLRPTFLEAAKKNKVVEHVNSILLCFGGSDFKNITKKTLEAVREFTQFNRIILILGAAYPYKDSLQEIISADKRIEVYHALKEHEMLEKMQSVQIAIVPASGILLETIAAGCNPVICYYAENQRKIFDYFVKEIKLPNFDASNFDKKRFFATLNHLILNPQLNTHSLKSKIKNSAANIIFEFEKITNKSSKSEISIEESR